MIAPTIERFRFLASRWSHAKQGTPAACNFVVDEAHREMFTLAQRICALVSPLVQARLDEARRAVMQELASQEVPRERQPVHMLPLRGRRRFYEWYTFQITPEVQGDPNLTGRRVSRRAASALVKAHRLQVKTVLQAIEGSQKP